MSLSWMNYPDVTGQLTPTFSTVTTFGGLVVGGDATVVGTLTAPGITVSGITAPTPVISATTGPLTLSSVGTGETGILVNGNTTLTGGATIDNLTVSGTLTAPNFEASVTDISGASPSITATEGPLTLTSAGVVILTSSGSDASGNINLTTGAGGTVVILGDTNVTGNTNMTGNLAVTGTLTAPGLAVTGISAATPTIDATTGPLTLTSAGTGETGILVNGNTTLTGGATIDDLTVTGTLTATVNVTGISAPTPTVAATTGPLTLSSVGTDASGVIITGDTTITGSTASLAVGTTIAITGGDLTLTGGDATFNNNAIVGNDLTVTGTLTVPTVNGNTTFANNVTVSGTLTAPGLAVTGISAATPTIDATTGPLTLTSAGTGVTGILVNGNTTLTGGATIDDLTVTGTLTASISVTGISASTPTVAATTGPLTLTSAGTDASGIILTGDTTITGSTATINASTTISGETTINGALTSHGLYQPIGSDVSLGPSAYGGTVRVDMGTIGTPFTITLPTPVPGGIIHFYNYFVADSPPPTCTCTLATTGTKFVGNMFNATTVVPLPSTGVDNVIFTTASLTGDMLIAICDGSFWVITAFGGSTSSFATS